MISFNTVDIKFTLRNKLKIRNWINAVISSEGKKTGDVAYVFCSDDYLGDMNEKYLNHRTLTDIITFDYSEKGKLSGDIFISIERVRENAVEFKVKEEAELARVMVHGILHLSGYKDKTPEEKTLMREKENYYLLSCPEL